MKREHEKTKGKKDERLIKDRMEENGEEKSKNGEEKSEKINERELETEKKEK